jgi:tRNA(fMet)-specific endonuclease VapC
MARVIQHGATDFFVTIVSFHEEFLGWNAYIGNAKKIEGVVKGYDKLLQILNDFDAAQVIPFDDAAAAQFTSLRHRKIHVGTMDLRIAGIALARSMTVLSRNVSDFNQIPGLTVEDWTI